MQVIDKLLNSEVLKVFILSMLPITELRFSIPYAANFYTLSVANIVLISIIGNISIGILILYIIGPFMSILKQVPLFNSSINYIFTRTISKSKIIERRKFYGLILFVGIPLPLTGTQSSYLLAYFLNVLNDTPTYLEA